MNPDFPINPNAPKPSTGAIGGASGWTPTSIEGTSSDPKMNYSAWNGDWRAYLEYAAAHGDQSALDRLLNYMMTESSTQSARDWTASREDSAYQRLIADMKAAGINPYAFATFGGSPFASSSSGNNYSGSQAATYELNKEKNEQNWLKIALGSALPVIGAILAALI